MPDHQKLFCLVSGDSVSSAFSVKVEKAPELDDIDANELTLWRVSIPVVAGKNVFLDKIISKEELLPTTRLSKIFPRDLPEGTIHIIAQHPQP
ncbi:hypothetical protein BGZ54_005662, partial [Gamsiella multidivaricata]